MMKFLYLALILSLLTFPTALAEDGYTFSLRSNETTGYRWSAFVLSGDAVALANDGVYESDPNPDMRDGVGGRTYFTLLPRHPGMSLVLLTYAQGWMPSEGDQCIMLADVAEDLTITLTDVTESSPLEGTVLSVDQERRSVLLRTERYGDTLAWFDEETELPLPEEVIVIYTNGVMTLSLPPAVNVLAWKTAPNDLAR